ncbi:MAG TPA: hypothetical protein VHA09_03965 [Nitrososphaera sp.]|nr:hypothetical protein [Nitrososphaera sp.]
MITEEELEKLERMVRILELIVTFFKYVPVLIGVLAAISLIFAAFNFVERSYGWAIVNLILGVAGMLFVVRVIPRNTHHFAQPADVAHDDNVN